MGLKLGAMPLGIATLGLIAAFSGLCGLAGAADEIIVIDPEFGMVGSPEWCEYFGVECTLQPPPNLCGFEGEKYLDENGVEKYQDENGNWWTCEDISRWETCCGDNASRTMLEDPGTIIAGGDGGGGGGHGLWGKIARLNLGLVRDIVSGAVEAGTFEQFKSYGSSHGYAFRRSSKSASVQLTASLVGGGELTEAQTGVLLMQLKGARLASGAKANLFSAARIATPTLGRNANPTSAVNAFSARFLKKGSTLSFLELNAEGRPVAAHVVEQVRTSTSSGETSMFDDSIAVTAQLTVRAYDVVATAGGR